MAPFSSDSWRFWSHCNTCLGNSGLPRESWARRGVRRRVVTFSSFTVPSNPSRLSSKASITHWTILCLVLSWEFYTRCIIVAHVSMSSPGGYSLLSVPVQTTKPEREQWTLLICWCSSSCLASPILEVGCLRGQLKIVKARLKEASMM